MRYKYSIHRQIQFRRTGTALEYWYWMNFFRGIL